MEVEQEKIGEITEISAEELEAERLAQELNER